MLTFPCQHRDPHTGCPCGIAVDPLTGESTRAWLLRYREADTPGWVHLSCVYLCPCHYPLWATTGPGGIPDGQVWAREPRQVGEVVVPTVKQKAKGEGLFA